jgi:putative ABC transport system permease protein
MIRHYVLLAVKVLLRRKFFTFISLFGISFTLVVLMVVTALLDHTLSPMAPETRQDRTVGVHRAVMYGPHSRWSSNPGFKLLDRYARDLPGVERLSLYASSQSVVSYGPAGKIESALKLTDAEFWRILDFGFLEGGPFTEREVQDASLVAVISETTRTKFFGHEPALGRTFEADGRTYRVVGVVADVSPLRAVPHADMWAPYTTAKTSADRDELIGSFNALALARDRASIPLLQQEFNSRLARAELPDPKEYQAIVAPLESKIDQMAREFPFADTRDPEPQGWRLILILAAMAALFMLLPTVNLVNINVSRIMERSSEIGVRKAFGAPSRTLVLQFITENVLLTLVGAAVGLVLAELVLRGLNASGLMGAAALSVNLRVFGWGLLLALVFGLVSGVYPAWRMSRLHPVQALKGAAR